MKDNIKKYGLSDFDETGTLKVSPLLFVIIVYLSRHLLLVVFTAGNVFIAIRRHSAESPLKSMAEYSSGPIFLIASLGSILVLIAMIKRQPKAGKFLRWIWKEGKGLLIICAVLDAAILLVKHWHHFSHINQWVIAGFIIDFYIIYFLFNSIRVKDTFSDFPPP